MEARGQSTRLSRPAPSEGESSSLGLRVRALELIRDDGLVADDPGVMAGRDSMGLAGTDLDCGLVAVHDRYTPNFR